MYCTAFKYSLRIAAVLAAVSIMCPDSAHARGRSSGKSTKAKAEAVPTSRVEAATPLNVLQQPEDRMFQNLYSPVLSPHGDTLYGINFLDGALERWDMHTGALLDPVSMPINLRYLYRTEPEGDTVWSTMEKQGFNPARFVSVCATEGELYALVTLPGGYSLIPTPHEDEHGNTIVINWPQWDWRQAVVRIADNSVANVYKLPANYIFTGLVADGKGTLGGICRNVDSFNGAPGDSAVVVALFNTNADSTLKSIVEWKAAGNDMTGMAALTGTAPDGSFWYCSPEKQRFFTRKADGTVMAIKPKGSLLKCGGSTGNYGVPTADFGAKSKYVFRLRSMVLTNDGAALLLVPANPESKDSPIVQRYDSTGTLRNEVVLDVASLRESTSTWMLSTNDSEALFLIATSDQHWRIEKLSLTAQ